MSYIPNTDQDVREMLSCIGRENADELFSHIPDRFRFKGELELPEPF
jgi:glycine cleavage system pyridoxal-binding protein P